MYETVFVTGRINVPKLKTAFLGASVPRVKHSRRHSDVLDGVDSYCHHRHPLFRLVRGTQLNVTEMKRFLTSIHQGLTYSVQRLKDPSKYYITKKKVHLSEISDSVGKIKKILLLDLDETLIHFEHTNCKADVSFLHNEEQYRFNVRPHLDRFLAEMNELYTIYVFTAGTERYAEPIVSYLNQKKRYIQGLLHRRHCLQTSNGYYVKDLRIISNRSLKDILIVDNLIHSFGLQLTNGIPIVEFTNNKQDQYLLGLIDILYEAAQVNDVRDYLKYKLYLDQILQLNQTQLTTLPKLLLKS